MAQIARAAAASSLMAALAIGAIGCARPLATADGVPPTVHSLRLGFTWVHLVKGERWVAIDTPDPRYCSHYRAWIEQTLGTSQWPAALVVTHAHADHVGCAAELQRAGGVKVIAGAGDLSQLAQGRNGELQAATLSGQVLAPLYRGELFPALRADVGVSDTLSLQDYGVKGRVEAVGGHTSGSVVVLLDSGEAFVGDLIKGGVAGGMLLSQRASWHYFTADIARNDAAIAQVLARRPRVIFPGHGGPLDPKDVKRLLEGGR